MKTNKKGFSAVIIIFIVAIVLALGASMYYFTRRSNPANQPPLSAGPVISLMLSSGPVGTQVTITGSGFLASHHDYYQVEFGSVLVNATFIDDNHMTFIVPTSSPVFGPKCGDVNCPGLVPPGNYNVWITGGPMQENSNSQTFTVTSTVATSGLVNYLAIKEWGIEFEKPAGIDDLQYTIFGNTTNTIAFTTQSLVSGYIYWRQRLYRRSQDPIGTLTRIGNFDTYAQSQRYVSTSLEIGNYYYFFTTAQATCSANQQVQALETQQMSALKSKISQTLTNGTSPPFPSANVFSQPVIATSMENPGKYTYAFNPIPTSTGNTAMQLTYVSQGTNFVVPDDIALQLGFGYNNADERIDVEGIVQDPADSNIVFVSSMDFNPENYNATSTNTIYTYNLETGQLTQIYKEQPNQYRSLNFEGLQGSKLVIWFGAPGYDKPCVNWTVAPVYLELADTRAGLRTFVPTQNDIAMANAEVQQCMNVINQSR